MRVGVPTEIERSEARVGRTIACACELLAACADVSVEIGAGGGCAFGVAMSSMPPPPCAGARPPRG